MLRRAAVVLAGVSFLIALSSRAQADLSVFFVENTISDAAKAADPTGFLNNAQCWSIYVTNTDGHWASAGLRMTLPAGNTFYNTAPARGGSDTRASPAFFPVFPDLEFDTFVSSARNQFSQNPPAVLGPFPEDQPPVSFGGASDPLPGVFSVSWGDPVATSGPGPGTYEIVRFTFPLGVIPDILDIHDVGPLGNYSKTSQVLPDITVPIVIPEPASLGALLVAPALIVRRRRRSASRARDQAEHTIAGEVFAADGGSTR